MGLFFKFRGSLGDFMGENGTFWGVIFLKHVIIF